jgi:hypothetical protein
MERRRVFISYAREDTASAQRLYRELQKAGLDPWLDKEELRAGERWQIAIRRAIQDSRFFIALLSSNAVGRKGFIHKELAEALKILDMFPESEVF